MCIFYSFFWFFFFSSRRRHTRYWRDWSSDVCSSDLRRGACGKADDGHVCARIGKTVLYHSGEQVHESFLARTFGSEKRRNRRSEERRVGKECRYRWAPCH